MNLNDQELYVEGSKVSALVAEICGKLSSVTVTQKYLLTRSLEQLQTLYETRWRLVDRVTFVCNRAPNAATAIAQQNNCDMIVAKYLPTIVESYLRERRAMSGMANDLYYTEVVVGTDNLLKRTQQQHLFCEEFIRSMQKLQESHRKGALRFQELAVDKLVELRRKQSSLTSRVLSLLQTIMRVSEFANGYSMSSAENAEIMNAYASLLHQVNGHDGLLSRAQQVSTQLAQMENEENSQPGEIDYGVVLSQCERAIAQRRRILALHAELEKLQLSRGAIVN